MRGKANELQQEYVRAILRRLDENPAYAPYQNKAQAIREAFDAVQAALERRRALLRAEDQVELDLKHVVMEVCEAYNACEPRLRLLFPNQPSLVERFFMPLRRRRSRSAAAEVEVEAQEVM